ncbi:hypothetical protein Y032_0001g297 [Ancylostoma ceylanicum]|uniref:Uncharacterized protein n=1 Tax=Ancylostoma ceylanicum TaxID=53326 RepID=A0A016W3G8_9BILA|nr:hypothetical protein Y032_0001g297 [Ancylostoma ceylanicum]
MRYRIYSTPTVTLQKWSYACSPQTESCSSAHFIGDERHAELDFVFNVGVPLPRLIASSPTMGSSRLTCSVVTNNFTVDLEVRFSILVKFVISEYRLVLIV